ncbi:MAG: hypothetical protein HC945_04105 [Nitrosarchaeum sp.]|nr:hypothetical protein [Nitrosarchaeum sp.]
MRDNIIDAFIVYEPIQSVLSAPIAGNNSQSAQEAANDLANDINASRNSIEE